jgi:thiosulfate dehydrogenase (quinone) large subunit
MWAELEQRDERMAYALLRLALGMNFLMHGVSRMMDGPGDYAFKLQQQFEHAPLLPQWAVHGFGVLVPGVEALLGALLIVGLRTKPALIGAALWMTVLTFGSGLIQNWNGMATQLTYAAIIAAMLAALRFNGWSVDAWLKKKNELVVVP